MWGASGGQNGPGGHAAACMWPNVLMAESDAASQSLKPKAKNQRRRKGGNRWQSREVGRGGEHPAE